MTTTGGQSDRAIDIPITEVLSSYGTFDSFNAAASHLKRACGEQYGTPGEAFIQYCCDNPDVIDKLLAMAPHIEDELLPAGCGAGERRVVKRLAGAVVAGRIAVLAGIFDEDALEKIDDAIKWVTKLWWGARAMSLVRIGHFLDENIDEVQLGKPDPDSEAIAFVDEDLIVIRANVFHREFGDDATRMLDELKGLNALVTEQNGRHVRRFCNGRFRGYAIKSKQVWPDEDQRAA